MLLGPPEPDEHQHDSRAAAGAAPGRRARAARSAPPIAGVHLAREPRFRSRANRIASTPWSMPQKNIPNWIIGPTGWQRNSNSVTTPKLPPPPRSAQNRSGCSSAEARTHARRRRGRPRRRAGCRSSGRAARVSQPMPPPSVRPRDPGVPDDARRDGEPVLLGGRVERRRAAHPPPRRGPGGPRGRRWSRVIGREVDDQPVVDHALARHAVPAASHGDLAARSAVANRTAAATSCADVQRAIAAGRRSMSAFQTLRASS